MESRRICPVSNSNQVETYTPIAIFFYFPLASSTSSSRFPIWLACAIASLPCALTFHRKDNVRLVSLIQEARRFCGMLRQCFILYFSCNLVTSFVVLLSTLFFLPPPLTGLQIIWLTCVITPLLGLSLLSVPPNEKIMTSLTSKNANHIKVGRGKFRIVSKSYHFLLGF